MQKITSILPEMRTGIGLSLKMYCQASTIAQCSPVIHVLYWYTHIIPVLYCIKPHYTVSLYKLQATVALARDLSCTVKFYVARPYSPHSRTGKGTM